jgi:hypothetical protein
MKRGRKPLPPGAKTMTDAERRAKSRLANTDAIIVSPPGLLSRCIPRGKLDFDEIESSGGETLALYNKLLGKITCWVDALDPATMSMQDGLFAFRLLAATLEALTELRIKIGEQRMAEAHDVTTARPAIWRADANSGTPNCLSDLWEHDRLQLTIKGGLKMFRSILIALLLAVSLGGAQAQTWREGKITYHKHGNIIYNNDG